MSTHYLSEGNTNNNTPHKKSKYDEFTKQTPEQPETIPLDVLKAEARERRNSDLDMEPKNLIEAEDNDDHCIICLQDVVDRTVLINCAHDRMCFACIKQWCEQSRRCPLCNSSIGSHLIHRIRSQYDYQKHYLAPLRTTPPPAHVVAEARATRRGRARRDATTAEDIERDELDRAIEKRRWVYRHGLFAKHVASNAHTRFRPNPTPQQISNSQELQSRCQMFVRRELRVWPNMDVEFLTNFILSLVKAIDIRTEASIKLISEFLDMGGRTSPTGGTIAEHFVHELYSYLRSPFRDLPAYDAVVQYDTPADMEAPPTLPQRAHSPTSYSPGPSNRRPSPHRRSKISQKREPSDPLEASPRDQDSNSQDEEDWVEPPSTNSKGKRREDVGARDFGGDRDYYGGRSGRRGSVEQRDGQRSRESHRDSRNHYEHERHPKHHNSSSRHVHRDDKQPTQADSDFSRAGLVYHDKPIGRTRRDDRAETRKKTGRQHSGEDFKGKGKRETRSQRPPGWDSFFEGEGQLQQADNRLGRGLSRLHSQSRTPSSTSSRSHSRSTYKRRRRSSSPIDHRQPSKSSNSYVPNSSRPLTTSVPKPSGDNGVEHSSLEQSVVGGGSLHSSSIYETPRTAHDSLNDETIQLHATAKLLARSRPARLDPIDAIRMHLQGPARMPKTVCATAGEISLRTPEAQLDNQKVAWSKNGHAGVGTRETSDVLTGPDDLSSTILDKASSPSKILDSHTFDDTTTSCHDVTTSDNASTVSYSIRGAAARPKSQPAHPSAVDSTQRASPGPPHGALQSKPVRARLLSRLEAAKSVGTISNRDTEASHLAKKPTHGPSSSEISESPVSETQMASTQEEERLRLMARSRPARSATIREGPSTNTPQEHIVARASHQEKKAADPNMPAELDSPTAVETERRLRLQARLTARKREITTLMGAGSSADALPRAPSSG